ncbi:hypothetical protein GRI97_10715 [Altererythrobacter xixiisoli]|uniref:Uncharacterized protein n=1 Tax=Croceibacterium xixiisoli TaxID=1476466 RepID=A0A6I4TW30_9SPHN|nr:hypothetical protein [Croceibacterium xixiisoli]MXO99460.1 hypothetical protein [Croceibacterium xixiisoli]
MDEKEPQTFYRAASPVYLSHASRLVPAGQRFGVPVNTPPGDGWIASDGLVAPVKKG